MKIGLYNLEPKYQNLALEKIRKYYFGKAFDCTPVESDGYDVIYCSSIFEATNKGYVNEGMIKGGTGFDLTTKLPPEIDEMKPHLNFGFTTRGCIRKCPFCVVPEKEGDIRVEGDLMDLWDGKGKEIILYDNNILALPYHFDLICKQARRNKLKLDFNQGLDHRLLFPEMVDLMKSISHTEYRFAFDHPSCFPTVESAIDLLQSEGIERCSWYVLIGYDTTYREDLDRLNYLRERNQVAYVQRYKGKKKPKIERDKTELVALARWANQHNIYRGMAWEQFLKHPDNKRYRYLLQSPSGVEE